MIKEILVVKQIKHGKLEEKFMYNRKESEKMLTEKYGFKSTGEKHFENYFTWWHISFYLFEKFGFDKRKAHLSSLVNSGQMTREEALALSAENPTYPTLSIESRVMKYPKRSHDEFKKDEWLYNLIAKFVKLWKS